VHIAESDVQRKQTHVVGAAKPGNYLAAHVTCAGVGHVAAAATLLTVPMAPWLLTWFCEVQLPDHAPSRSQGMLQDTQGHAPPRWPPGRHASAEGCGGLPGVVRPPAASSWPCCSALHCCGVTHGSLMHHSWVTLASLMGHSCITHASLMGHSCITHASLICDRCSSQWRPLRRGLTPMWCEPTTFRPFITNNPDQPRPQ
jgi:hypothetical protein